MKIFHEKMVNEGAEDQQIITLKEVADEKEAENSKEAGGKNYVHYCFHDESNVLPCRRTEI